MDSSQWGGLDFSPHLLSQLNALCSPQPAQLYSVALVTWLIDGGTQDSVILDLSSEGLPQHGASKAMQAGEACIANLLEPLFNNKLEMTVPTGQGCRDQS